MRNRIFENREVDEQIFELQLKNNVCSDMFNVYKQLNTNPLNFDLRYIYGKLVAQVKNIKIELFITNTKKFFINLADDTHTICDFLIDDVYNIGIEKSITNVMSIILNIIDSITKKATA